MVSVFNEADTANKKEDRVAGGKTIDTSNPSSIPSAWETFGEVINNETGLLGRPDSNPSQANDSTSLHAQSRAFRSQKGAL
jgi:hypothetical protein